MAETHIVFNDQLELYGQRFITKVAPIPEGEILDAEIQKRKILALLFEQFLLFDRVAIKIDQQNLPLYFLIKEIGIDKVQELIERGIIIPVLWTPGIYMLTGTRREDGTTDESTIIGKPPFVSGFISDIDPEKNIEKLLSYFQLTPTRKKSFKRSVAKKYILPNNDLAGQSVEIVMDAYNKNRFASLNLPADKKPEDLNIDERSILYTFGHQVLETSVLAEKMYKSYDKYTNLHLTQEAVKIIESAYHVSENTSKILTLEHIADLKNLAFENKIPFERVFDIRYKSDIKKYRKWINEVSVDNDSEYITKQYIDEVTGKSKFIESNKGKFLRTVGMLGVGTGIGALLTGGGGALAGAAVGKAADLGLSLFDTYVLDGVLKGWNPRMFVDRIKIEAENKEKK